MKAASLPRLAFLLAFAVLAGGCATSPHHSASAPILGTTGAVSQGTVLKVRPFIADGQSTRIGRKGALVGAALGTGVGGDFTSTAVGVAFGAILGEWIGTQAEAYLNREQAEELTIQTESGPIIVVAQIAPPSFAVGDEVEIVEYRGRTRVTHR